MANEIKNNLARFICVLSLCAVLLFVPGIAWAESGMPVAFRTWPDQTITIETYWGLHISVGPGTSTVEPDPALNGASLAVRLPVDQQDSEVEWAEETSQGEVSVGLDQLEVLNVILDREPNTDRAGLIEPGTDPTANAVSVMAWRPIGADPVVLLPVVLVQADGVDVVYGTPASLHAAGEDILQTLGVDGAVDVAVLVLDGQEAIDVGQVKALGAHLKATHVYLTGSAQLTGAMPTREAVGNTTALLPGTEQGDEGAVLLKHADKPWQAPEPMDVLLTGLESAAGEWAAVFEPLSINQMNHRPANGTHTPRWNVEHMASRQMFFLTLLYNWADPTFPHLRLDPAQMPPDYKPLHPDWTGAEEARRIYRTCAFVRRFAYTFNGKDLNQPAPGGRINFNAIVLQLTRHYPDHTRNVLEKMELDDWPQR